MNVVVITVSGLHLGYLGCYGNDWVETPNLDRLASAWLIRRFIDSRARFKFVSATRYAARAGELCFDMPRGEFNAMWTSGDVTDKAHGGRYPGRLELDGKLADGVAARIARYLPLGLPEATRHYVEGAVRGGTVKAATYRVKGYLRDFPFHNARTGKDGDHRVPPWFPPAVVTCGRACAVHEACVQKTVSRTSARRVVTTSLLMMRSAVTPCLPT